MKNRRRVVVGLGVTTAALGLWTACTTYDGSTEIPDPDAAPLPDAMAMAMNDAMGTSSSGSASTDGSAPAGDADASDAAPTACAEPCDCDGDGYVRKECADAADTLYDCDDNDRRRHPGQSFLPDKPGGAQNGDWDCDRVVEKEYAEATDCVSTGAGACSPATPAFFAVVPCGESGQLFTCKGGLVGLCQKSPDVVATQGCR